MALSLSVEELAVVRLSAQRGKLLVEEGWVESIERRMRKAREIYRQCHSYLEPFLPSRLSRLPLSDKPAGEPVQA